MKPVLLREAPHGSRVRLADGRVVICSSVITGDRFVRAYLGDWEWAPGKWGAKEGPMEVLRGDVPVEVV